MRTLVWFSCGAASALAAKLTLAKGWPQTEILYCDTGSEHPDNERFLAECEEWYGQKIKRLKSEKYKDIWDVFEKRRFLVSPNGALCTTELKKNLRAAYQRPGDVHVFGYTSEEKRRAERFEKQFPDLDTYWPLIEHRITKADCFAALREMKISLPAMYELGYRNNNCIGCPKGGQGYWNKIRVDFPDVFARMIKVERSLGRTVLRKDNKPLPLCDLAPSAGRYEMEPSIECGITCHTALAEIVR